MNGETDLKKILRSLEPVLDPRKFTFSTHPGMSMTEAVVREPLALFQEKEGLTMISEGGDGPYYSMISLSVHSSLEAVGLTAAMAKALTDHGISANVVAAYYHDHVFVKESDGPAAVAVLQDLARKQ